VPVATVEYSLIPCIACHSAEYMRLLEPNLAQEIFKGDLSALMGAIEYHNEMCGAALETFRQELISVMQETFPGSHVVEAGSSGRGTFVFPLSDIDMVCMIRRDDPHLHTHSGGDMTDSHLKPLKKAAIAAFRNACPHLKVKWGTRYALDIVSKSGSQKLSADLLFGVQGDRESEGWHSASQAQARKDAMQALPRVVLDAAKLVKLAIKAYDWPSVRHKPPAYLINVVMKFLYEFGAPRLCSPPAWDSCFDRHDPRPYVNLSSDCYMLWRYQSREYAADMMPGTRVVLKDLIGKTELNGKEAVISGGFDHSKQRYPTAIPGSEKPILVLRKNLELLSAPQGALLSSPVCPRQSTMGRKGM